MRTIVGLAVAIAAMDVAIAVVRSEIVESAIKLAFVVLLLLWARRFGGLSWDDLGLGRAHVSDGLRLGVVTALAIAAVILVLVLVPESRSYFESSDVAADGSAQRVLEPIVYIPVGTVLFEELIFRGVLLGALLRIMRVPHAIGVSALLFGAWHIPPAMNDAAGNSTLGALGVVAGTIAATTCAGVVFAYVRVRSKSVLAPVLAHTATNSFSYLGAVVALEV